jgi:hypothetical protein
MPLVSLPAHTGTDRAIGAFQFGTFCLLEAKELCLFCECCTQRLVLEAWNRLQFGDLI